MRIDINLHIRQLERAETSESAHTTPAVWAKWCDDARTACCLGRMVRSRTYSQLFGQNGAMAHVQPTIWAK
ncbi:hypothetical protein KFV05_10005 [Macrococcoides canis]|uniref:hypothetical protein n=1 Tax=Macrococcoides canis TaxID=1855823 RepID=UPI0020B80E11|nr:hypothetical protein [Macrococcus canis]UTH02009.1 hypothetical protein KFV05_10005 [Macrococcus canis]